MPLVLGAFAVTAVGLLLLAACTGLGARRRGAAVPLALVEGALFPIAWLAWYVVDEGPALRNGSAQRIRS